MNVGMPSGAVPTYRPSSRSMGVGRGGTREVVSTGPTSERPTATVGSPARATQLQVQAVDCPQGHSTTGLQANTGPITRQDNLVQYTNDNNMVPQVSGDVPQSQRLTAVVAGSFGESEE